MNLILLDYHRIDLIKAIKILNYRIIVNLDSRLSVSIKL